MSNYLYIFEDGTVGQSLESPSNVDVACIKMGTLRVIQTLPNGSYLEMNENQNWMPVDFCKLADGCEGQGSYHYVE